LRAPVVVIDALHEAFEKVDGKAGVLIRDRVEDHLPAKTPAIGSGLGGRAEEGADIGAAFAEEHAPHFREGNLPAAGAGEEIGAGLGGGLGGLGGGLLLLHLLGGDLIVNLGELPADEAGERAVGIPGEESGELVARGGEIAAGMKLGDLAEEVLLRVFLILDLLGDGDLFGLVLVDLRLELGGLGGGLVIGGGAGGELLPGRRHLGLKTRGDGLVDEISRGLTGFGAEHGEGDDERREAVDDDEEKIEENGDEGVGAIEDIDPGDLGGGPDEDENNEDGGEDGQQMGNAGEDDDGAALQDEEQDGKEETAGGIDDGPLPLGERGGEEGGETAADEDIHPPTENKGEEHDATDPAEKEGYALPNNVLAIVIKEGAEIGLMGDQVLGEIGGIGRRRGRVGRAGEHEADNRNDPNDLDDSGTGFARHRQGPNTMIAVGHKQLRRLSRPISYLPYQRYASILLH
jgi:hypothetical protein